MKKVCRLDASLNHQLPSVLSPFVTGSEGNYQFSMSESTRIVGNKKTVTKKVVENGVETITVTESGVLKLKTVNGVPQALEF
jgi:DnaJ family protein B protein 6